MSTRTRLHPATLSSAVTRTLERLETPLGVRGHEYRVRQQVRDAFLERQQRFGRNAIDLVEDMEHGTIVGTKLIEHRVHDTPLLLPLRMARVDHVQQQIRLTHFLERRAERRDQMVRQLADEADRVREQDMIVFAEIDFPR